MSFPATVFDWTGEYFSDDKWSLRCDYCTKVEDFSGMIYKIVDHPEEEGWTLVDGKPCCDLCSEKDKPTE